MSGGFKRNVTLIVKLSRRSLQHSDFYVCSFPTAQVPIHKKNIQEWMRSSKAAKGSGTAPPMGTETESPRPSPPCGDAAGSRVGFRADIEHEQRKTSLSAERRT